VAATREAKAIASNTNRGSVERMDRLASERPDLAVEVRQGPSLLSPLAVIPGALTA